MGATVVGKNLTKTYNLGDQMLYALNDVSLEVYPGEMVAIIGRTGSGKSTLLHTLGCLQRPDSGRVLLEDLDVTQLEDEELARVRAQKVGFIFQAFNLLPNETAATNVEVALWDEGMSPRDRRRRVLDALTAVGLGNRLDRTLRQLSTGQRQSVAVARALVNDPIVIFADEPTKGLASTSREEVLGLFQSLNNEGRTIVIASAESGVASYCRRTVRITEGTAVDRGLVSKRRIIPGSRVATASRDDDSRGEETVCPRCNRDNPPKASVCYRCRFPLNLSKEEMQSIEGRLRGIEGRGLGVESTSDQGKVPGQEYVEELKKVPFLTGLGPKSLMKVIPALESGVAIRRALP